MSLKDYLTFIFVCFICETFNGQNSDIPSNDILKSKSYEYLITIIENENNHQRLDIYNRIFLNKAKADNNWDQIAIGYRLHLYQSEKHDKITYADSMIIAAKRSGKNKLVCSAYLTKGVVYFHLKDYNNALENYLLANQLLKDDDDKYFEYKIKYNIAQIKYFLGFYDEAIQLFKDCIDYYKESDDIPYLASLHSLSLCYNRLSNYELASKTNELGIEEAENMEAYEAIPRFVNSEGINQYFKKNYNVSLTKLNESLPHILKSDDMGSETMTYFYIGKNYWDLGQYEKAVSYFMVVDKLITQNDYVRPDLRENYELLIYHFRLKGKVETYLNYVDKLLLVDKFLQTNYSYLLSRIVKEYDTKELLQAKIDGDNIIRSRERLIISLIILTLVLGTTLVITVYKFRANKRMFIKLMDRKNSSSSPSIKRSEEFSAELDINPEVITSVLNHLEIFENKEKFLVKDLTLPKLAKSFNSNIVYVSKIIMHYRHKKSVDYINDLKVEYIIKKLKSNPKFRLYTNKALAEEAHFSTTQHFTRAFMKNTGISPTYFVKQLNKLNVKTTDENA